SGGKRKRSGPGWPGWPPGLRPVGFLTTGLGAWGGLWEGGNDELEAFWLSRSSRSRTRASRAATCCCRAAMRRSRSRHPGQTASVISVFYAAAHLGGAVSMDGYVQFSPIPRQSTGRTPVGAWQVQGGSTGFSSVEVADWYSTSCY